MSIIVFTILLLLGAYCAGLLGSLTGLGGGVIVIPLLTLVFGIDFHYVIGAALRVCQNVHILFFMNKAPTFSSQGFAIS